MAPIGPVNGAVPKLAKALLVKNRPSKARPAVGCTGGYLQAHGPWKAKHAFVAAHWKHGRRSRAFTEARKQIWADLRAVEARMRADGFI